MKKQDTWSTIVAPIGKFLKANRGSIKELATRMEERTGEEKNWRHLIDLWTTNNAERSVQPLYSVGKILLEEAKAIMEKAESLVKQSSSKDAAL